MAFINKMDKMGADFFMSVESIQKKLTDKGVVVEIPYGAAADFK
jgi:elongation factor G